MKSEENKKLSIPELVEFISKLSLIETSELLDVLKKKFDISDLSLSNESNQEEQEKKEKKEEVANNVDLKILGFDEEKVNTSVAKLSAYKLLVEILDDIGTKTSLTEAMKLVQNQSCFARNVDINHAKEIQSKLNDKGIQISLVSITG